MGPKWTHHCGWELILQIVYKLNQWANSNIESNQIENSTKLPSGSIMDTKFEFDDYEEVIYRELSKKINWSQTYEEE